MYIDLWNITIPRYRINYFGGKRLIFRLANGESIFGERASALHPLAETYLEYLDLYNPGIEVYC